MSGFNPNCYFEGSLERWSVCDGHWFCMCAPESADVRVRILHEAYKEALRKRHDMPAKDAVTILTAIDDLAGKYMGGAK